MRLPSLACLMSSLIVLAPGAAWSEYDDGVNGQITDSVTEANTKVLGDAPALSMGNFYDAAGEGPNANGEESN